MHNFEKARGRNNPRKISMIQCANNTPKNKNYETQSTENKTIRGAQAAEGGLQGAGACSGPRASPGQHARLWVSRCRLLQRRSSIAGGRLIFSNFHHPTENKTIRGAQAAEGGLQGTVACSGQHALFVQHSQSLVHGPQAAFGRTSGCSESGRSCAGSVTVAGRN